MSRICKSDRQMLQRSTVFMVACGAAALFGLLLGRMCYIEGLVVDLLTRIEMKQLCH
jgi:hypothetical protein